MSSITKKRNIRLFNFKINLKLKTFCTESKFLNILLISLDNHRFKSIAKVSLMSYNIPEEVKEAIIFSNVTKKAKIFISSEYLPMEENRN